MLQKYVVVEEFLRSGSPTTRRRGPIAAEFTTPGPAAIVLPTTFGYDARDLRKGKAPAYSFYEKRPEPPPYITPAPGAYPGIEGMTHKGRPFSPIPFMSPKLSDPEPFVTPAPGAYPGIEGMTHKGRPFSPIPYMAPKLPEPQPYITPSPTAYHPEKALRMCSGHRQSPQPSFGIKHSPYVLSYSAA